MSAHLDRSDGHGARPVKSPRLAQQTRYKRQKNDFGYLPVASSDVIAQIVDRTDGVPLFVEEKSAG